MAGEIPDVLPGELIESAWGNQIRDRALMRYINAAERDTLNPTPNPGDLAYLDDVDRVQFFDGGIWDQLLNATGDQLVDGEWTFAGNGVSNAFFRAVDGSEAFPGFSFASESGTGWYVPGVGQIAVSLVGQRVGAWTSSQFQVGSGADASAARLNIPGDTAATPAFSFVGSSDKGMYSQGTSLGFATSGQQVAQLLPFASYQTAVDNSSQTVRNILVGTGIPNDAWGKDGDIYFRYDPTA